MLAHRFGMLALAIAALFLAPSAVPAEKADKPEKGDKPSALRKAFIDGTGHGWRPLGEADFVNVNCDKDTWNWKKDGTLHCTGLPIGVARSKKPYTNFELVLEWMHEKSAGNSGVFVWTPEESLKALKRNQLPSGIEVQVLDHGYKTNYEKGGKRKA